MLIKKVLLWAGTIVAAGQFLGCSKISEQSQTTANAIGTIAYQQTHRKIYQHSVIPGGVYSGEELARARRTDPVVAQHYSDFDLNTHVEKLSQDMLVYVSYRRANKVFWTKKKHLVCKGEAVLVDSKNNLARTRCGNRLSKNPKLPNGKNEPPQSALDMPLAPTGPTATGAGPFDAVNLPPASPFGNDGIPHDRPGITDTGATPVTTGAGRGALTAPDGFNVFPSPYFSAGPLVPPGLLTATTGGGSGPGGTTTTPTGTTTPSGGTTTGGTTTGGGTSTGGGTTTTGGGTTGTGSGMSTTTPEPSVFWLMLMGSAFLYGIRRNKFQ